MPIVAFCPGSAMTFSHPSNALKSQGQVSGAHATRGILPPRRAPVTVAQWASMGIFETEGPANRATWKGIPFHPGWGMLHP